MFTLGTSGNWIKLPSGSVKLFFEVLGQNGPLGLIISDNKLFLRESIF